MIIRPARVDEAEELTRLARQAKAAWGYPDAWLQEWAPRLSFSAAYLAVHAVFVAASEGEPIGVIALEDEDEPEIAHLWVQPARHGAGVGRALVRRAMEYARQRGWASLRVETDPHAQAFYERMGAVRVGTVPAPVAGLDRQLPVLRLPVAQPE